jgi:hypothetical protein
MICAMLLLNAAIRALSPPAEAASIPSFSTAPAAAAVIAKIGKKHEPPLFAGPGGGK